MSNPSEPHDAGTQGRTDDQTEQMRVDPESEPVTEIIGSASAMTEAVQQQEERRFTAPSGFDGSTQKITPPPDPETEVFAPPTAKAAAPQDRKSTRLNSSHSSISYAVFCLKKKKKKNT